jgi:chemosensory pili system protein ChpB (putative protein-glutamate methylesterase)
MRTVPDAAPRVALLARAGAACDHLQAALQDAGADIVLVADPADSDVAGVRAAGAQAILIALEPLVEAALDRYDALLADPTMTVIFDEAELAAQRKGWDAARWSRHLAAKLNRHQQVLPPGTDPDSAPDDSGEVQGARQVVPADRKADAAPEGIQVDSLELPETSFAVEPSLAAEPSEHASYAFDPVSAESGPSLTHSEAAASGIDLDWTVDAFVPVAHQQPQADGDGDVGAFLDEMALGALDLPADRLLAAATAAAAAEPIEIPHPFDPSFAEFDGGSDFDLSAFESDGAADQDVELAFEIPPQTLDDASTGPAPELEVEKPPEKDPPASSERFRMDLDALELRIADMQLEDVRPVRTASPDGAVLVLAGIGGPDAVRQLLAGLPATFPRAVLIQQRLEGARHDNLVRQMQRATKMPVQLAETGGLIQRGHVYVLPADTGIASQADGLHFAAGGDSLLTGLPAADSAIVLLSGADPSCVDAALTHGLRGTLVAGQSAEGCFDAVASEALVARGGESATPVDIARKLAQRWQS